MDAADFAACRNGDESARNRLWETFNPIVAKVRAKHFPHPPSPLTEADLEAAGQDALLKALADPKLDPRYSPRSWLSWRVRMGMLRLVERTQGRGHVESLEERPIEVAGPVPPFLTVELLASFPDSQRRALLLRLNGYSVRESARIEKRTIVRINATLRAADRQCDVLATEQLTPPNANLVLPAKCNRVMTCKLPGGLREGVRAAATAAGVTDSEWIRRAIAASLAPGA